MPDQLDQMIHHIGGVPLKRYCQITGETPNTVYQRKFKEIWIEGRELYKPEGSDWWVDLVAVRAWMRGRENYIDPVEQLKQAIKSES